MFERRKVRKGKKIVRKRQEKEKKKGRKKESCSRTLDCSYTEITLNLVIDFSYSFSKTQREGPEVSQSQPLTGNEKERNEDSQSTMATASTKCNRVHV